MAENKSSLNIAGKLAEIFIQSKLTVLLMVGALLVGVMALVFTPRTYNPEIVVPVVNIAVSRPGSNTDEMLRQIVKPLEALMAAIPGVEHTYGMATDDSAMVTVRFKVNEDEEDSIVKVYKQINSNMLDMPAGTQMPLIQALSLYDVPIVTVTLSSPKYNSVQLRAIASQLLEDLRSLPQVGKSWIAGSSKTALRVWLDPKKLAAYYIPLQNIKQALLGNNVAMRAGKLDSKMLETPLRVDATLIKPADVGNVVIGIYNAAPVYLRDVAKIEIASEDDAIKSYIAFGSPELKNHDAKPSPAVTIALARQKGSNGVEVAKSILERVKIIQKQDFLSDVKVTVTRDYGSDANDAVNTLVDHLGIAIFSVVLILLMFLGWREASIVAISIPIILFLVLGVGWIAGQTINRITLFALILSLGLLVDDSIVVIENIHRHIRHTIWDNFNQLVVKASDEIGRPTIIATFTVMLALLPMGFVSGMMGPFMAPIPFNTLFAMFISLIIAYTIVPYLARAWLEKKAHNSVHQDHNPSLLQRSYTASFSPLLKSQRKRHIFYITIVVALGLAMLQPLWQFIRPSGVNGPLSAFGVELKMLPDDNVNTFLIEIDAKTGSTINTTQTIADEVNHLLAQNNYITDYQTFLGEAAPEDFGAMVRGDAMHQGENYAQIRVSLVDKHQRSIGSHQIVQELYPSLVKIKQKYPGLRLKLFETPPGPPVRSQMEGALYGPDYSKLQNLAEYVTANIYPKIYGMINIDNSVFQDLMEYQILIDRNKAIFAGLFPAILAGDINGYFAGLTLGSMHIPGSREPENIIVRFSKEARQDSSILTNLYFLNRQNQPIPLSNVASLQYQLQAKPIFTRDQYPVVYVGGEMLHSCPVYGVISAMQQLKNISANTGVKLDVNGLKFAEDLPDSGKYQISWLGEMRLTMDVFRDLGVAFIVALVLIYLLLTGFYRSFSMPLIIMGAIPLTIIGVFPGHWLMNQPFTATSMIGVIALAGIVVRNSLLLIDFILEHRKQGEVLESAVLNAAVVRLSPILLTALAIILGSAIMITDPVFGGLAISLIFGSFTSTALTLYLIPLVYYGWVRER